MYLYDACVLYMMDVTMRLKRILVDKSELSPIKQSDKQALNYVIDNGKKIGNIDFFDIYVFDEEK